MRSRESKPPEAKAAKREAIRKAREIVARYIPISRGLVDDFIAERREEAAREDR